MKACCPTCGWAIRVRLKDDCIQVHNRTVWGWHRWEKVKCPGSGHKPDTFLEEV